MRRLVPGLLAAVLLGACTAGETDVSRSTGPTASVAGPTSPEPSTAPTATGPLACGSDVGAIRIPATANVFGAGVDELPQPAGGGGGTAPVCVAVPDGATVFTVLSAGGTASFAGSRQLASGPDGDTSGAYAGGEILAASVVSGIVSSGRVGFVTGVFLGDAAPDPTPPSLDVSASGDAATVVPELGQLFPIGDGRTASGTLQSFAVPPGATRLYLGIADAFSFNGPPGFWDDNLGGFSLEIAFA